MKTKLGVSTGLLAAGCYFIALFGGYAALIILAGYVLLVEDDAWLRKSAIKAVIISVGFSVLAQLVGLIPNLVTLIDGFFILGGRYFSNGIISGLVSIISVCLTILEKLLLLLCAFAALVQAPFKIGSIDSLIDKHTEQ